MIPTARFRALLASGIALLMLLGCVHFSLAQVKVQIAPAVPPQEVDENGNPKEDWTDAMSLPTDQEAGLKINTVRIYIKKENPPWETIIEVVQRLLEADEDSLLELKTRDEGGREIVTKVSVRAEVNRLIASFSNDGRQFYQNTYGPRAQARLQEAYDQNDLAMITEVSQRYLHTKAGAEATLTLATVYLNQGLYQQAASCYARFLTRPADEQKEMTPADWFRAALAFRRIGDVKESDKAWVVLEKRIGDDGLRFAGRNRSVEELRTELERKSELAFASLEGWPMFKGNSARNAMGVGGVPFLEPRFTASMFPEPTSRIYNKDAVNWIETNLAAANEQLSNRPIASLPAFFPVAAKDRVIYRTYFGLSAVATRDDPTQEPPVTAGELVWVAPAESSLYQMVNDPQKRQIMDSNWWRQWYMPQNGPFGIFFENGLVGGVSHDGRAAYFVDDLAVPPHPNHMMQFQGNFQAQQAIFAPFTDQVMSNELISVNLDTGKELWRVGGRNPVRAPVEEEAGRKPTPESLYDGIFLGAPLPVGGRLYVLMEKDGELRLVCLDPSKVSLWPNPAPKKPDAKSPRPEVCWIQPLGSPNNKMPQDTLRRIQGVNLSFSDGVLVVPTNAGVILGIELLSRSLLWAHSYREATAEEANGNPGVPLGGRRIIGRFNPQQQQINLNQERWRSSAPIIVNGKVIFTAYDGASVQCISLRDGNFLWKSPRTSDDLYLAGVHDNTVMIVSKKTMRGLSLDDGKTQKWKIDIGTPAGHGVTGNNGIFYLPVKEAPDTKDPEVWAIDLNAGKLMSRTKSRKKHMPGNLLFYEGDVYSQTATQLSAYPQLQIKLAEMDKLLAANPKDPVGLTERGELRLDKGELLAAATDLQEALRVNPPEVTRDKARRVLYETITEMLQRDFNAGEKYLDEYKALCEFQIPADLPPLEKQQREEELLRRKSKYFALVGKGRESQGRLVDAFENYMAFGTLNGNLELADDPDDPSNKSRPDVWARGRIEKMIRTAKAGDRAPLENRIAQEWEKVKDLNQLDPVRNYVRVFGNFFRTGKQARLKLADLLTATGNEDDQRDAQNLLLGLRNSADVDNQIAAEAIDSLARLFIRKGLFEDAVGLYAELGTPGFAKLVIRDGKTGDEVLNELLTDKRFLPYLEPLHEMWNQRLKAEELQGGQANMAQSSFTIDPEGELLPFYQRHRLVMDLNPQGTGRWQLRIVDRVTGEDYHKFPNLPPSGYIHNSANAPFKIAYVRGHMLLLNLNTEVFAFDLADKKLLWTHNLFGSKSKTQPQLVNTIMEPDGPRLVYQDGWTQKLGQLGVIEASYVCLTTRDGLVALDPARGTVLWKKTNVSPRVRIFGDESHVYVIESNPDGSPCPMRCVRAQDGVSVDIPDASALVANPQRYRMVGRNLLVFTEQGDKKVLRFYDVHTGKDLWRKEFDNKSIFVRGEDDNLVGVVTPQGEWTLWNVKTNKQVFTAQLDAKVVAAQLDKVNEAVLLTDRERYYLMLNRPVEAGMQLAPNVSNGIRALKVNGTMYCFDKMSGKRLWYTQEQFENQSIILEQFQDLPLVIAATQFTKFNNGQLEAQGVRVVAIDKATGAARFRRDLSPNAQFYTVNANAKAGFIELWRNDLRVRFVADTAESRASK